MTQKEDPPNSFTGSATTIGWNTSTSILVKNEKVSQENEKYDPFANRILTHPNSFTGAFLHVLKTALGTGILSIPRAFKSAGLLVGFMGSILVGIMCTHAVHILVKASRKVCIKTKTPSLGYADTAEGVFKLGPSFLPRYSKVAKYFVEGGLCCIHFLADCVYIVFMSVSLTKLLAEYYPECESWGDVIFKLILLGPLLVCGQIRELKHLVPFSFISNVLLFVTFGITGYYIFIGIGDININDRHLAKGVAGIPSFFSTVLFSMEGIGTIMPIENSMPKPNFIGCPGVLNSAMTIIVILYTSMGFLGYLRFGEETEATITKNLPSDEILAQVCQVTISVAVFFSFMLIFYVPVDIIWSKIKPRLSEARHNIAQIILRSVLIILATCVAIAGGENLGTLIDLIGAIFLSTLGLFVPALLEIIVDWEDGWGTFHWRLIKNIVIMILSLFGLVSGSYYALKDL